MAEKPPKDDEKVLVEPVPKDRDFFLWLEQLFDGETLCPEKIEVRVVKGPYNETLGALIKQILFPAQIKATGSQAGENGEKPAFTAKLLDSRPSKEKIVALSNEILFLIQRDCDQSGRETKYGILAYHFSRGPDHYERWIRRCSPQKIHARLIEDDEDGDGRDPRNRYADQFLNHDERMFTLNAEMSMGLFDRQDRELRRLSEANAQLRADLNRKDEMMERALSLEHQRKREQRWDDLKISSVQKGLDMAAGLAPPLLNQLLGRKVVQTEESPESLTLRNFFKRDTDGGQLTQAQVDTIFGVYDDTPENKLVKGGILSIEQAKVLYDVAFCKRPASTLDEIMPNGPIPVTQEQFAQLQQNLTLEQLSPLMALFMMRQQRPKDDGNGHPHP